MEILEELFTSKARVRVIAILLENDSLYESEIAYKTGLKRTSAQNELIKLNNLGILKKETTPTKTFYSINKSFLFYHELKSMFVRALTKK